MVRFVEDDGDEPAAAAADLAPVIPLFGGAATDTTRAIDATARRHPAGSARQGVGRRGGGTDPQGSGVRDWSFRESRDRSPRLRPTSSAEETADEATARAERSLLRKLHTRSLSVSEARSVLRSLDVDAGDAEGVIDRFLDRGYLDDAALAEQLVHAGSDRKGQGRRAIALTLAKRGVPREVADAALATLPDDDGDRALEFARTRARALRSLDPDVALRRLIGQLSRRGYGGSVAMDAARTALRESL